VMCLLALLVIALAGSAFSRRWTATR
jgi:hypothetical protein